MLDAKFNIEELLLNDKSNFLLEDIVMENSSKSNSIDLNNKIDTSLSLDPVIDIELDSSKLLQKNIINTEINKNATNNKKVFIY